MNLAEMLKLADKASEGVEVSGGYEPIPAGSYEVVVTKATGPKNSRRANPTNPSEYGQLIELEFTVTGGDYNGRKVFSNNNIIVYPKAMDEKSIRGAQIAMAIGAKERKVLLDSLSISSITMAEELVGASCMIDVIIGDSTSGGKRNEVKKIYDKSSPAKPSAPVQQATVAPANAKPKMPWEK